MEDEWKRVAERLAEIGERPEESEVKPEVRHIESLTEWYKSGQRPDAVLTMGEWVAAVRNWRKIQ